VYRPKPILSSTCRLTFTFSIDKSLAENITSLIAQPSIAAGVGLVYKFDWVRVEANFGVPLAAASSDGARKGFQVGMGIDFL
jgi:outer membrane protein insertion porin family